MVSSRIARLLPAVITLLLLSPADLSAQLETVWTCPGANWVAPDGLGGAFVTDSYLQNGIARVDSTGAVLWHQNFAPPAWPWEYITHLKTILDHSKSLIEVWRVSRDWDDPPYSGLSQTGCAVWKYDSLGTFQWLVYTQFPDSVNFLPYAVSVESTNTIAVLGGYNDPPCESLNLTATGIMRVSSNGAMSFDFQCGSPRILYWTHWPEDPHQTMTFSADYDEEVEEYCPSGYGPFYFCSHTLYRYVNGSIQKLSLNLKDRRTPVPSGEYTCGFDWTGYRPLEQASEGEGGGRVYLECDPAGNTFEILQEETHYAQRDSFSHRYLLAKYTPAGGLAWMVPLTPQLPSWFTLSSPAHHVVADHEGSAIVESLDGIRKFTSGGALQWYVPIPLQITDPPTYLRLAVDKRNNVYARIWTWTNLVGPRWFMCLDSKSGKRRFLYNIGGYSAMAPLIVDSAGCIYGDLIWGGMAKLRQNMTIVLRDAECGVRAHSRIRGRTGLH
jgi:hypothetical protein